MNATPVHIVDDDPEVLASLALLLQSHGWRVEAHASAEALLGALDRGAEAGCVVSDVRMPGMDGLALQRVLKARGAIPVLMVTGHADVPLAVRAMREGAADFIEKPYDAERMIAAVTEAMATGERARAKSRVSAEAAARLAQISAREREVMELLLEGNSNKLVAARLGISVRTAEVHRANLMEKLKVRDLPALVRLAMHAGRAPGSGGAGSGGGGSGGGGSGS
jgi:two-component system response regulator FixJ